MRDSSKNRVIKLQIIAYNSFKGSQKTALVLQGPLGSARFNTRAYLTKKFALPPNVAIENFVEAG